MDRVGAVLLEALKQALAEPQEHRLFRSGKLAGLFASRAGTSAEAARRAIAEGFLEVIRTEPKGHALVEWVRATPSAVDFVHAHESPAAALRDLQRVLEATHNNLPLWLAELRQRLDDLRGQMAAEVEGMARRLNVLCQRVAEAIERIETSQPQVSPRLADQVPWANDVVQYLARRGESGGDATCPLSELFSALRVTHPQMTVAEFHNGLRRLFDRSVVRLLPASEATGLPEPEYALLDGTVTYYFVTRAGSVDGWSTSSCKT